MAQDKYIVKEKLAQALAGDKNAATYFNLGGHRDVAVNLKRQTTWEGLNDDYHNFAVQWRAAKCLQLKTLEIASKTALIYLSRIAVHQFDQEVTGEALFVTEREVLEYMKVLMEEFTPVFQQEDEESSDSAANEIEEDASEDDTSDAEPPRKKTKESATKDSSEKKTTQAKNPCITRWSNVVYPSVIISAET